MSYKERMNFLSSLQGDGFMAIGRDAAGIIEDYANYIDRNDWDIDQIALKGSVVYHLDCRQLYNFPRDMDLFEICDYMLVTSKGCEEFDIAQYETLGHHSFSSIVSALFTNAISNYELALPPHQRTRGRRLFMLKCINDSGYNPLGSSWRARYPWMWKHLISRHIITTFMGHSGKSKNNNESYQLLGMLIHQTGDYYDDMRREFGFQLLPEHVFFGDNSRDAIKQWYQTWSNFTLRNEYPAEDFNRTQVDEPTDLTWLHTQDG